MGRGGDRPRANHFNALRLGLASAVIVTHSAFLVDGDQSGDPLVRLGSSVAVSHLAVAGFFLLSGYLIAASWDREPAPASFARKRALRIYPAFFIATLVCVFVVGPMGGNLRYWAEFRPARFLAKLLTLGTPGAPAAFGHLKPALRGAAFSLNNSMWTIPYEVACYACIAAMGVSGLIRRRWLVLSLAACVIALDLAMFRYGASIARRGGMAETLLAILPRMLACFLAGSCYYQFRDQVRLSIVGSVVACASLAACLPSYWASQIAIPLAGGYLLLTLAFAPPGRVAELTNKADISYGVYLYAWPIQLLMLTAFPSLGTYPLTLATLPLAAFAGLASWHFIERPALKLKGAGSRRATEASRGQDAAAEFGVLYGPPDRGSIQNIVDHRADNGVR